MVNMDNVRKIVENADNLNLFDSHILEVVKYGKIIAKMYNEDEEAVELACLLHDYGKFLYGKENHNVTGAIEASKILNGYNIAKTQMIVRAILSHSGDEEFPLKDTFSKILSCADALSHIDLADELVHYKMKKGMKKSEAIFNVIKKIENEWKTKVVLDDVKKMYKQKCDDTIKRLIEVKLYE